MYKVVVVLDDVRGHVAVDGDFVERHEEGLFLGVHKRLAGAAEAEPAALIGLVEQYVARLVVRQFGGGLAGFCFGALFVDLLGTLFGVPLRTYSHVVVIVVAVIVLKSVSRTDDGGVDVGLLAAEVLAGGVADDVARI